MIARLVAEGAKVGVVAQSHAVIENLMLACCAVMVLFTRCVCAVSR